MVRREEQPWQSRATLFLDTRRIGHRGSGPVSSFEWAVSATASIGLHLLRRGYALRLLTDAGVSVSIGRRDTGLGEDGEGMLLDALAVVGHSSVGRLDQSMHALPHEGSYGMLIAVLGVLTPQEAEAMVRIRQRAGSGLAMVIDAPTWALSRERDPERVADELAAGARLLQAGGWRVAVVRSGEGIASAWARLALGPDVRDGVPTPAAGTPFVSSGVPLGGPGQAGTTVGGYR